MNKQTIVIAGGLMALVAAWSCGSSGDEAAAPATGSGGATTGQGGGGEGGMSLGLGGGSAQGGGNATTGGTGGTGASAAGGAGGIATPTEIAECQGFVYECGDLQDNDGDGLIDSQDPDCLGPCDNTEDSLFGGIPGQNAAPCQMDCYWDHDTGSGNDKCYWSHWCDPNSVAPNYYPEPNNGSLCEYNTTRPVPVSQGPPESCDSLFATQDAACTGYCEPLTPNGCDCFGCCELPAGSGKHVWLGSVGADGSTVCTFAELDNPDVCHPCLQVDSCVNDCETCELCIGKTTLPPECYPGGAGGGGVGGDGGGGTAPQDCPAEYPQACGLPGQDPCPSGTFCLTGCCVPEPQ